MAKILIVDDRITNRELLLTLLGYAGHQLFEASDGEEGLALTRAEHPELIITDIMMPKMDGYEFARQVRADDSIKDTQIIFYTSSYVVAETMRLARACGVSIVIGKPIEPELFLKKVNEALATHQAPTAAPESEEFHREHMRMLTDTLVNKVEALENEILERKQIESILQASELRFRSLIEHGLDSISLLDANGNLIWESPSASHMLGYTFNEYIGKNLFELLHPDDLERILTQFQELAKEPQAVKYQTFRLRHANGKWIWVEGIGTNLLNEPSVNAIVVNYRDITESKKAQEALIQSEERFSKAFYQSPVAISLTDLTDNTIREVNDELLKLVGLPREQIIGFSASHLNIQFDQELREEAMRELQEKGAFRNKDVQIVLPNGNIRYALISGALMQIEEKPYSLNFLVDITDRKEADDALKRNEQVLRLFVENSPAAIAMLDRDMKYVVVSRQYIEDYKITEKNIIGRSHYEIFPEVPEHWKEIHKRCLNGATEKSDEDAFPRQDGHIDWVRWEIHPWYEADNQIGGLILFSEVITARKQIQQALRDSEGQYRKLFEDSPTSLWVEDFSEVKIKLDALRENGVTDIPAYLRKNSDFVMECAQAVKILDVNTTALRLYHASNKDDLMDNFAKIYATMASEQFEYELIQLANNKLNFQYEGIDRTLTGAEIHVSIHWSVVPGYEHSLARVIVSIVDLTERKKAEEKIQLQLQRLNALRSIDLTISNTFDMNLSLKVVLNIALSELGVSAASVLLFNPTLSTLEYAAGEGFNFSAIEKTLMRIGEGLAGRAALERTLVQVNNLELVGKNFSRKQLLKDEEFVSYFAIPLIAKGELKGVFEVFTRTEFYPDKEWINFFETLAGQAAFAINDSQLFNGLQRSNIDLRLAYDATIEGWSAALDLRDKETEGHSQRVTEMTLQLARKMNISESELMHIRRGALLHDIGKLGVPDSILLKTDKLTDEEWKIMQKHPTYAYEMLSTISYLKPALDIPYAHHEKWDGSGYPRGLKKAEIPLAARIFAVVDVWDALTNDRVYRKAWSTEKALAYIQEQSGKHFEPKIVEIFLGLLKVN